MCKAGIYNKWSYRIHTLSPCFPFSPKPGTPKGPETSENVQTISVHFPHLTVNHRVNARMERLRTPFSELVI